MEELRYYLIKDRLLGKYEDGKYFLYINDRWEPDRNYVIFSKLNGYDPYESDDSPYGWGSTSVMDEIEEIGEKEAEKIMEGE